jgi:hypothetical protein
VDGGGLISGGRGSSTDGGAEKAREKQSRAGARGRRREGRGSRDLFAKLKNYRDSSASSAAPSILTKTLRHQI